MINCTKKDDSSQLKVLSQCRVLVVNPLVDWAQQNHPFVNKLVLTALRMIVENILNLALMGKC